MNNRQTTTTNLIEGDQVFFKLNEEMAGPGVITKLDDEMHTAVILYDNKFFKRHFNLFGKSTN